MGTIAAKESASSACGWIYFVAWSVSFYGQIYENWKHKNVSGLKLDYVVFNVSGYIFYSIYNSFGLWGNPADTGLKYVQVQDLLFAYHGYLCMLIIVFQCVIYPKTMKIRKINASTQGEGEIIVKENTVSKFCIYLCSALWFVALTYSLLTNDIKAFKTSIYANSLNMLGYLKLIITLVKYIPQAVWNYQRKSTQGWSIFNIICDMIGGIFSFAQNFVDMSTGNYSLSSGLNITKFLLSVLTMFFDALFMVQHYLLYPPKSQAAGGKSFVQSNLSVSEGRNESLFAGVEYQPSYVGESDFESRLQSGNKQSTTFQRSGSINQNQGVGESAYKRGVNDNYKVLQQSRQSNNM